MHITGQAGIELSGCGWHSVILDNTVDIGYEKDEIEKIEYFKKHILKGNTKGFRFMPSLSNIFGDTHLVQRKADDYLPFDYLCADCIRSYVEFIHYLLKKIRGRIKHIIPQSNKTVFLFPMTDYLFEDKQEEEIFYYLEKLQKSLDDEELKILLKELIEFNREEIRRYYYGEE